MLFCSKKRKVNVIDTIEDAHKPKYLDEELSSIFVDDKPIKHKNKK